MRFAQIIAFTLLVFGAFVSKAQEDSPVTYGSFFGLSGSRYEPAGLGRDFKTIDISLINAYAWAGNTTFTRDKITQIIEADIPDIDDIVSSLRNKNRVGFGASVEPLHIGYRLNKKAEVTSHGHQNKVWCPGDFFVDEVMSFSFGITERAEMNILYPGDVFRLAWKGNKQFAGETASLRLKAGGFYAREYTLGFAMPLKYHLDDFDFRIGARVKRLHSFGAIYTKKSNSELYTDPDGRFLNLTYDYHVNMAFDENNFSPLSPVGKGWGTDLGFTAHYKQKYYANINLLDFGYIRFKNNTRSYRKSGEAEFDGILVDNIFQPEPDVDLSEYEAIYTDNEFIGETWSMPYPMRIRMHASYRIPATNRHGEMYHKHSFSFTYIQGLVDIGSALKVPYFAGAYDFNLWDHFEVGTNLGFSGFNKIEIGSYFAFRVGFFRMGVGSGNIAALIPKLGTGADINFNMTLGF